jgi:hypothetical protein
MFCQDRDKWTDLVKKEINVVFTNFGEFLDHLSTHQLHKKDSASCSHFISITFLFIR